LLRRSAKLSQGRINAWTWAREFRRGDAPRGGVPESVRGVEGYERRTRWRSIGRSGASTA